MPFFPSWKALFEKLAKDSPNLEDFQGYSQLLVRENSMEICKMHLTSTPHCALLTICNGHMVKIIHHFHHDVKTPALPAGADKLWALIGPGATTSPIGLPDDTFNNCDGVMPTFKDISGAVTLEDLVKVPAPDSSTAQKDPSLKCRGKKCVAVPPFLATIMMGADAEDAFQLLRTGCKALSDFDTQVPATVAHNLESEARVEEQDATDVLFRVVQFLHLVATKQISEPYNLNRPQEWAAGVKHENGVAINGGSGTNATSDDVALRLGATDIRPTPPGNQGIKQVETCQS